MRRTQRPRSERLPGVRPRLGELAGAAPTDVVTNTPASPGGYPRRPGSPSWASELSALLAAMRDMHGALIELEAREARLFELVESVTRLLIDESARRVVADERDPIDESLLDELIPHGPGGQL